MRGTPTKHQQGLPAKLFICLVSHGESDHLVIASSADRFDDMPDLAKWANSAHKDRKKKHGEQLSQLQKRVSQFYNESDPFVKDEVDLWNFIHRWKILNTPKLQDMEGSTVPTHFDEVAAALDVSKGLEICPGCYKCRAVHTFKLSAQSIKVEAEFPGNLAAMLAQKHPSCSCCEDLGSLLCVELKTKARK